MKKMGNKELKILANEKGVKFDSTILHFFSLGYLSGWKELEEDLRKNYNRLN